MCEPVGIKAETLITFEDSLCLVFDMRQDQKTTFAGGVWRDLENNENATLAARVSGHHLVINGNHSPIATGRVSNLPSH
jgi:hypothetical protein